MTVSLNNRQLTVLQHMRNGRRVHMLYEGSNGHGGGSGLHYLDYAADLPKYDPLTSAEVDDMVQKGLIEPRWPKEPEVRYFQVKRS